MTTSATLKGVEYCLVKVLKDATNFDLPEQDHGSVLQYRANNTWHSDMLPPGIYTPIGLGSSIIEKVARGIVERCPDPTMDLFTNYNSVPSMWLFTGVDSLHSWLRSLGHEPSEVFLLQKNK